MADSKLQELTKITTPQNDDLLYVVRNENGTYTDNQIAKSNLIPDVDVPSDMSELTDTTGVIPSDVSELADSTNVIPKDVSELTDSTDVIPEDVSELTDTTDVIPSDVSELTDSTNVIPSDISSNVLLLNNTTEFTPDADYEPSTKKYVDDNAGGTVVDRIYEAYTFEDMGDNNVYYKTVSGSGSLALTHKNAGVELQISTTNGSYVELKPTNRMTGRNLWNCNPVWGITLATQGYGWATHCTFDLNFGSSDITDTGSYMGFRMNTDDGKIYAQNCNGTTRTATDTGIVFASTGNAWIGHDLDCKMTSGEKIEFYIDGVLKATHTTNLPTTSSDTKWIARLTRVGESGNQYNMYLQMANISYDMVIPT